MSHSSPVAAPRSTSHRRAVVLFWLGVLIAAVMLFWSLRGVAWVDLHKALLGAKWRWLLVALGLMACSMGMRALRWATLFPPSLGLSGRSVFAPMMVGYLFNLLLPGRMGELVRSVALAKQTQKPASGILATIVVERLVDALLMVLFAVVWWVNFRPEFSGGAGIGILAVGLVGVLCALVVIRAEVAWVDRLLRSILRVFPTKLSELVWRLYLHFREGLRSMADARQFGRFLGITLLIWSVEWVTLSCLLWTFSLSLKPLEVAFLLAAVALGSAILPAPGQVGTFQFFAIQAAMILGVQKTTATGFALIWHAAVFSTLALLGVGALLWLRQRWARWMWSLDISENPTDVEKNSHTTA
ncbi:flippase-like domain-containing protein [Myxococcota bacterium]|nr:flippase-like domain-containing protein [Myxococcota bacterium]